ncbi:MAG: heme-binding beta-barrel domain-containing protein [Sphingomicrobium sp.]
MPLFPEDIFTEPTDVDPDTLANLGPLRRLAGSWQAEKGVDLNPKADGPEQRKFIERIEFIPIDPQPNGPQLFYGLRYHIHINTVEEDITFHDQVGYWLWEPATGLVLQTVAIPRGQVVLASGQAAPDSDRIILTAERGQTDYGICSTAFLEYAFRTDRYRIEIEFHADGSWSYVAETTLTVHGEPAPFTHRDRNRLVLVKPPLPNPLFQIVSARQAREKVS